MAQEDEVKNERTVTIGSFDGGYNITDPADLVGDNQMTEGSQNFLVEKNNMVERRPGFGIYAVLIMDVSVTEHSFNAP